MILWIIALALISCVSGDIHCRSANETSAREETFTEKLFVDLLPDGNVLHSFQFEFTLPHRSTPVAHSIFPQSLADLILNLDVHHLDVRLTQGTWDSEKWGATYGSLKPSVSLDTFATSSGAFLEIQPSVPGGSLEVSFAPAATSASHRYRALLSSLGGLICTSFSSEHFGEAPHSQDVSLSSFVSTATPAGLPTSSTYTFTSRLPAHSLCTENLAAIMQLLPCGSRAGLAGLLDAQHLVAHRYLSLGVRVLPLPVARVDAVNATPRVSRLILSATLVLQDASAAGRDWYAHAPLQAWLRAPVAAPAYARPALWVPRTASRARVMPSPSLAAALSHVNYATHGMLGAHRLAGSAVGALQAVSARRSEQPRVLPAPPVLPVLPSRARLSLASLWAPLRRCTLATRTLLYLRQPRPPLSVMPSFAPARVFLQPDSAGGALSAVGLCVGATCPMAPVDCLVEFDLAASPRALVPDSLRAHAPELTISSAHLKYPARPARRGTHAHQPAPAPLALPALPVQTSSVFYQQLPAERHHARAQLLQGAHAAASVRGAPSGSGSGSGGAGDAALLLEPTRSLSTLGPHRTRMDMRVRQRSRVSALLRLTATTPWRLGALLLAQVHSDTHTFTSVLQPPQPARSRAVDAHAHAAMNAALSSVLSPCEAMLVSTGAVTAPGQAARGCLTVHCPGPLHDCSLAATAWVHPHEDMHLAVFLEKSPQHASTFPPDAARGVDISPAHALVLAPTALRARAASAPALAAVPTPDQSMPFNVLAVACTAAAFCIGGLFNLLGSSDKDFALLQRATRGAALIAFCRARCRQHACSQPSQHSFTGDTHTLPAQRSLLPPRT